MPIVSGFQNEQQPIDRRQKIVHNETVMFASRWLLELCFEGIRNLFKVVNCLQTSSWHSKTVKNNHSKTVTQQTKIRKKCLKHSSKQSWWCSVKLKEKICLWLQDIKSNKYVSTVLIGRGQQIVGVPSVWLGMLTLCWPLSAGGAGSLLAPPVVPFLCVDSAFLLSITKIV